MSGNCAVDNDDLTMLHMIVEDERWKILFDHMSWNGIQLACFCMKKSLKLSTRTLTDSLAGKGHDLCVNIASML